MLELYKHLHRSDIKLDNEAAQARYQRIVSSDHLFIFIGEIDDVAACSCYLNVIENLTRGGAPYAVIENVVTHADYRRLGFGRNVVQHALRQAWKVGCYKAMLMTGNADNIPFYESCGFDASAKSGLVAKP